LAQNLTRAIRVPKLSTPGADEAADDLLAQGEGAKDRRRVGAEQPERTSDQRLPRANRRSAPPGSRRTPYFQGNIDGLCGFYGIINAFQCLFPATFSEDDAWELMVALCEKLAHKFPGVIWRGAGVEDTVVLFEAAKEYAARTKHLGGTLHVTRPFARRKMERMQDFWKEIADFLEEGERRKIKRVAFIGIGHPDNHWTVVTRVTPRSVTFFDSWELKRLALRQFTVSRDVAKANGGMHKLDTRQTFLMERQSPVQAGRAATASHARAPHLGRASRLARTRSPA
jgi:hypothetical protein